MEILTGEQMRRVDRRAIETLGIPSLDLMEAAGRGVAEALLEDYPDAARRGIVVLCGKGNNGGDGLVAARHLARAGVLPNVLLIAASTDLTGDAATNLEAARGAGLTVREATDPVGWSSMRPLLRAPQLIVDALLGTGVRGGARGLVATAIEDVNAAGSTVVSIDVPSGLDVDLATVDGPAVRAERTYTLCRPKPGLLLAPGADRAGAVRVLSIGIPDAAVDAEASLLEWFDLDEARRLMAARSCDSHKGDYGHLLAVAGSRGKSGAAVLLGRGALRAGAGLVTVATSVSAESRVAVQQAELMTEALAEDDAGALAAEAGTEVLALAASRDALALGPGLGGGSATQQAVRAILAGWDGPLVVDADGLNALGTLAESPPARPPAARQMVLTPHPGEAARLLGRSVAELQADRLETVRQLARTGGAIAVLKGHRTLVADPDGRVSLQTRGNPGMATAGSGDVLTGVLGAFLARRMAAWNAARLAVFVHAHAGDLAARARGVEGMIAGDLVQALPAAMAALSVRED